MNNLSNDKFSPINSLKLFVLKEHFDNFVKLYRNKKLPKIILLTGEKGIGKFTLIFHFINYVLSINSQNTYNKEELLINESNDTYKRILSNVEQCFNYIRNEKPNPANIENIRELKKKFYQSSLNEKPRFTILDDVELMNLNAANALLKLIEEPSVYDYYILINNKKHNMIETLRSRSIEIKIFLDSEDKKNIFNSLNNNFKIKSDLLIPFVHFTSPGTLIRFSEIFNDLKIEKEQSIHDTILKTLEYFKKNKDLLYLDFLSFLIDIKISELIKDQKRNSLETLEIKNKLNILFDQYRKFNLNIDSFFNQLKLYASYVR